MNNSLNVLKQVIQMLFGGCMNADYSNVPLVLLFACVAGMYGTVYLETVTVCSYR